MDKPEGFTKYGKQGCCPKDWNEIPDMTGYHEIDASIMHCKNTDAARKLVDHLVTDVAYKRNTAYSRSSID